MRQAIYICMYLPSLNYDLVIKIKIKPWLSSRRSSVDSTMRVLNFQQHAAFINFNGTSYPFKEAGKGFSLLYSLCETKDTKEGYFIV